MTRDAHGPVIHVVAGAVTDGRGRVLIAQRPAGKHLAGRWEFPGGKLEPGETRVQGLARELREELGIEIVGSPRPLMRVRHAYPFGAVLIDMWVVSRYRGEPTGLDGQQLRWCSQHELATARLLPADRPIVKVLRLPERLRRISTRDYHIHNLETADPDSSCEVAPRNAKLLGLLCPSVADAMAAAAGRFGLSADFLVMRCRLSEQNLAELCESVTIPVFARAIPTQRAFALGSAGINAIEM